ncbi:MAG: hypothetical protein V1754_11010 [Pseudomonadota bacterium]
MVANKGPIPPKPKTHVAPPDQSVAYCNIVGIAISKRNGANMRAFLFSLVLLLFSCGTSNNTLDDAGKTSDATTNGDAIEPDKNPPCGPGIYPCGPYGTENDEVIENFVFTGFADPGYRCKAPQDMVRDLATARKISFMDTHQGDPTNCKNKELLWVMVSAGWCDPCHLEARETQEQYEKGAIDPRVILVNIVFEDTSGLPVTEDFLKIWAQNNEFQLTFPVLGDPDFIMSKYFDKQATPFNMLVDLKTMEIWYRTTGANLSAIGQAMWSFFDK